MPRYFFYDKDVFDLNIDDAQLIDSDEYSVIEILGGKFGKDGELEPGVLTEVGHTTVVMLSNDVRLADSMRQIVESQTITVARGGRKAVFAVDCDIVWVPRTNESVRLAELVRFALRAAGFEGT